MTMKIKNLDGEIVDILAYDEIDTDKGRIKLKKWFVDENIDKISKLKKCRIEKETDKAILIINDDNMLWIPKSVILRC